MRRCPFFKENKPCPNTKKRRFEFVEGNSRKFWEISVPSNEVQVQYGRIGTKGQVASKVFPDKEAANKHHGGGGLDEHHFGYGD